MWVALYAALAVVLTWPLVLHLNDHAVGLANLDQMDTALLRGVVARMVAEPGQFVWSTELGAPVGYPARVLLPNWVDHLSGAPLVWLLPWPLSDNLWWLAVLTLNGLAAHVLGVQVGGSHRAGVLCGVAFASCDAVLREATFGHAPQAMVFWGPLYLAALLRVLGGEALARRLDQSGGGPLGEDGGARGDRG